MTEIIFQGTPIPKIQVDYHPSHDEQIIFYFTGGAYSDTIGTIGYNLYIADTLVGTTSIFSNGISTHRALNPTLIKFSFQLVNGASGIDPVSIRIEPMNTITQFDVNDKIILAVM
jgi:hypothetical protein